MLSVVACGGKLASEHRDGPGDEPVAARDRCPSLALAEGSAYAVGARRNEDGQYLRYRVTSVTLGPRMVAGTYTFDAPPIDDLSSRTYEVRMRDETGTVIATAGYDWQSLLFYDRPYTFVFGEYVSLSLVCDRSAVIDASVPGGCSMSLYHALSFFDGTLPFRVECVP